MKWKNKQIYNTENDAIFQGEVYVTPPELIIIINYDENTLLLFYYSW